MTDLDITMPTDCDQETELQAQVADALSQNRTLEIRGGHSKAFYGLPQSCDSLLVTTGHSGVISYEPTELAITLRAGTSLKAVEALLDANGQQFPFEPPHFGDAATIGGMVASGLSGPARAYGGSVRDSILGARIINGRGEVLKFGGQVMKNVAGYDTSRLMVGALGTLGVLLEVSLKVMPKHMDVKTVVLEKAFSEVIPTLRDWAKKPVTMTASAWVDGHLYARLGGTEEALKASTALIGGEAVNDGCGLWQSIREQQHRFFTQSDDTLWRLSVAPASEFPALSGEQLIEWGGALRWLKTTTATADEIRTAATAAGGHATLFRNDSSALPADGNVFTPLSKLVAHFHQQLKTSFDPDRIFNPGRLYKGL